MDHIQRVDTDLKGWGILKKVKRRMITIDIRWLNESGMGTYIENVVPGIISQLLNEDFTLIGSRAQFDRLKKIIPRSVNFVETNVKPYSIAEQLIIPFLIPWGTKVFFTTHFNVPFLVRGRLLVTLYDLFHLNPMVSNISTFGKIYTWILLRFIKFRADTIITISRFTKQELMSVFGRFTIPILPIHLGVDSDWSKKSVENLSNQRYLVCLGNMKPHKNLNRFVEAYINISHLIPHNLLLIGKCEGFITGDKKIFKTASLLPGRIRFTGIMPKEDVIKCIGAADALIFPSLYEGFGLPPLEAMAIGCPVLASDIPSVREVCEDKVYYFNPRSVIDMEKKLMELLADPLLRDNLSSKGRVFVKKYSWEKCISSTTAVMASLLN